MLLVNLNKKEKLLLIANYFEDRTMDTSNRELT